MTMPTMRYTLSWLTTALLLVSTLAQLQPNYTSPTNVSIYNPSSVFPPTGPWSLMSRAGPTLYITGTSQIHGTPCSLH